MRAISIDPVSRWHERWGSTIPGIRRNGIEFDGHGEGDINHVAPRGTHTGMAYELSDGEAAQVKLAMERAGITR
jgi:hypothetical protein